jgi:hypothetical protein
MSCDYCDTAKSSARYGRKAMRLRINILRPYAPLQSAIRQSPPHLIDLFFKLVDSFSQLVQLGPLTQPEFVDRASRKPANLFLERFSSLPLTADDFIDEFLSFLLGKLRFPR